MCSILLDIVIITTPSSSLWRFYLFSVLVCTLNKFEIRLHAYVLLLLFIFKEYNIYSNIEWLFWLVFNFNFGWMMN